MTTLAGNVGYWFAKNPSRDYKITIFFLWWHSCAKRNLLRTIFSRKTPESLHLWSRRVEFALAEEWAGNSTSISFHTTLTYIQAARSAPFPTAVTSWLLMLDQSLKLWTWKISSKIWHPVCKNFPLLHGSCYLINEMTFWKIIWPDFQSLKTSKELWTESDQVQVEKRWTEAGIRFQMWNTLSFPGRILTWVWIQSYQAAETFASHLQLQWLWFGFIGWKPDSGWQRGRQSEPTPLSEKPIELLRLRRGFLFPTRTRTVSD